MPNYILDPARLHAALDAERARNNETWRDIATATGISASTLTRIGQGHRPDVDALITLLMWLGLSFRQFVQASPEANPSGPSRSAP